jgi:hypothetical protein
MASEPDQPHTLMVALNTQDSCAAYATPVSLGKLKDASDERGTKCISPADSHIIYVLDTMVNPPRRARRVEVFPDAVGPIIRLIPSLKIISPLAFSLKDVLPDVPQEKDAFLKPHMSEATG